MDDPTWKPLDLDGLRRRLVEIKSLLEQAAAVGMAQDVARLDSVAELQRRAREPQDLGRRDRRRYR